MASSLHIYPNPANDYLVVNGLPANARTMITIADASGKPVAVYDNINAAQYRCNISKLTAGVYFLQIKNTGKPTTGRFIKE